MSIKCNGAFEGGGVKGIGLVGALSVFQENDYEFVNVVGTSAGAIVAALIAVGYTIDEITNIMKSLNYLEFKQKSFLSNFGIIGKTLNIGFDFGIYSADYFEDWLNKLLLRKGKTIFKDIKRDIVNQGEYKYKLRVTASDLTSKKLLVLPEDLKYFGIDPDTFSIAKAVRMSMSIPIFYEPYRLKDQYGVNHLIVDGGLLSNYPMWVIDDGNNIPIFPTFGFRFVNKDIPSKEELNDINFIEYLQMIVSSSLDAHDKEYISVSKGDYARTILIPTRVFSNGYSENISATNFKITKQESEELYKNGVYAAELFLSKWNFNDWKNKYRNKKPY